MTQALQWCARLRSVQPGRIPLRMLLLAAHPDDETIGASVPIVQFSEVHIVYLTDGAPQDRRYWSADFQEAAREEYASARRIEALCAVAWAGVSADHVRSLGAPDQQAVEQVSQLAAEFCELVLSLRPDLIITHAYEGGHPDHDAAALIAALTVGRLRRGRPELVEMASYHGSSGRLITGEFLPREENLPHCEIDLSPEQQARKQRMLDVYHSQRAVLRAFSTHRESLRLAPTYDFTKPPHAGKLWYEQLGWPMSGEQWRSYALSAMDKPGIAA